MIRFISAKTKNRSNEVENNTKIVYSPSYKLRLKPAYVILELREDSPAYRAGLQIGDTILSVNNKPAHQFTLQGLMDCFTDDHE